MIEDNVILGENVEVPFPDLVNLYGCEIGDNTFIGPFVEIQKGVKIGSNCRIQSHTFICSGVTIGNNCFIGHNVSFTNDKYPIIKSPIYGKGLKDIIIEDNVVIGTGATILPDIIIREGSIIAAGAIATKSTGMGWIVASPAAEKIGTNLEFFQIDGEVV